MIFSDTLEQFHLEKSRITRPLAAMRLPRACAFTVGSADISKRLLKLHWESHGFETGSPLSESIIVICHIDACRACIPASNFDIAGAYTTRRVAHCGNLHTS